MACFSIKISYATRSKMVPNCCKNDDSPTIHNSFARFSASIKLVFFYHYFVQSTSVFLICTIRIINLYCNIGDLVHFWKGFQVSDVQATQLKISRLDIHVCFKDENLFRWFLFVFILSFLYFSRLFRLSLSLGGYNSRVIQRGRHLVCSTFILKVYVSRAWN